MQATPAAAQRVCAAPLPSAPARTAPAAWRRAAGEARSDAAARSPARGAARAAAASEQAAAAAAAAAPAQRQLLSLKEWSPTCAAIAAGEQTILLRKGGIKEPTFKPAAAEFLLFPTSFHTEAELLTPAAAQRYAAECAYDPKAQAELAFGTRCVLTGCWSTRDPSVLEALQGLHVWAPSFLEARLKWRGSQPITVLELRAFRLPAPLLLPPCDEFFGCFSWVDVAAGQQPEHAAALAAAAAGGVPALDDGAFAEKQALCRRQLASLSDLQQLPLPAP